MHSNLQWMGIDDKKISYPGIDTCISITCVVTSGSKNVLAGAHIGNGPLCTGTNKDIDEFGSHCYHAISLYIIGNMGAWADTSKNKTGLHYNESEGGTLLQHIWTATQYRGDIYVFDLSKISKSNSFDVEAELSASAIDVRYKVSGDEDKKSMTITDGFCKTFVVSNAALPPIINSSSSENTPRCRCVMM